MTRRFEIVWSSTAKNQLFEIADVIAADKPRAAEKWMQTVLKKLENASKMPLAFRKVPELDAENIREVIVGAYRVVFRLSSNRIEVLSVFHGHSLSAVERLATRE
jgi:plasmid stabilization system protein ParE